MRCVLCLAPFLLATVTVNSETKNGKRTKRQMANFYLVTSDHKEPFMAYSAPDETEQALESTNSYSIHNYHGQKSSRDGYQKQERPFLPSQLIATSNARELPAFMVQNSNLDTFHKGSNAGTFAPSFGQPSDSSWTFKPSFGQHSDGSRTSVSSSGQPSDGSRTFVPSFGQPSDASKTLPQGAQHFNHYDGSSNTYSSKHHTHQPHSQANESRDEIPVSEYGLPVGPLFGPFSAGKYRFRTGRFIGRPAEISYSSFESPLPTTAYQLATFGDSHSPSPINNVSFDRWNSLERPTTWNGYPR